MELKYKTKIDIFKTTLLTIELIACFIFGFYISIKNIHKNNGMLIFGILLLLVCAIQLVRVVKRFELYEHVLIINRPLSFTSKTNTVLKISDIKKITFRQIKGRFGGPVLILNALKSDETYRINFPESSIDEFEAALNKLGIETFRDGI